MSTILEYIKEISSLYKTNSDKEIEHSNEFSIESEKTNASIKKCKVKFVDSDIKINTINNTSIEKISLYLDNLKSNFSNYYESSNIITTIITILFMVIKILYKNKDIK